MRKFIRRSARVRAMVFVTLVPVLLWGGCGYSTTSRTARDIKTIHIQFLIDDNTLKVTNEDRADAILEGKIVGFVNRPFSFNLDLNAEEYHVEVRVQASLFSRRTNSFIWQNRPFSGDGSYFVDRVEGGNTFEDAVAESIKEITDRILNLTTQDW
jgi:hypothetical protein